jgi:hypothetical protein
VAAMSSRVCCFLRSRSPGGMARTLSVVALDE